MVTVRKAFGFRFVIFSNDHEPAHVHIFGQGGEAKINLTGLHGLQVEWVVGIGRADMRRLMAETQMHREMLLDAWRRLHG